MNEAGMDRTEPEKCPNCGALLPAGTLAGLCPACLLQQGAAADTATGPKAKPFVPPTVEEVARLFPQLEILGFLGKGGMGAVYKARQPALDRFVALKTLPAQSVAPDPGFAERFTREARALARLSHPNIVAVFEYGQVSASGAGVSPALGSPSPGIEGNAGGTPAPAAETPAPLAPAPLPYFIMEFVDGVNLRQLQKAGRLSPREALQIVPQICDALQYAHDAGVVHRDIKPENVLVDRKGRVKIADFGLAKILGHDPEAIRLTGEGQVMGTPHYMAPEQVEHPLTVDHRADIFSLGVVFYEMLTGELPLGKFQPPSRKVQVDVRLDDVVLHALEKEPERRYQHVSEVKTAVETISGTTHSGPAASARPRIAGEAPREVIRGARLSRAALAGGIWAPFAFLAFLGYVTLRAVPAGECPGPARLQILLMVTLLPLGLTAPFGTTLLGWIAIAQIRRSAGRLYGLGIALFEGLVFPLLALDALIFSLFHALMVLAASALNIRGQPGFLFVLLPTLIASAAVDYLIARAAWCTVNKPLSGSADSSSAPPANTPTEPARSRGRAWKIAAAVIVAVIALNCVIAILALRPGTSTESPPTSGATTTPRPAKPGGPFLASLPQGTIELVAISRHPSTNQVWWKPDGSSAREVSFGVEGVSVSPNGGKAREFVIRLTGLPEDASWPIWEFDPATGARATGGRPSVAGRPVANLRQAAVQFPSTARTTTIKLGFGWGQWETLASEGPASLGGTRTAGREGYSWQVTFSQPTEQEGCAVIAVAHSVKEWEARVIAVDKDGQEHPSAGGSLGGNTFQQTTANFDQLPLSEVKEFRFQARPYRWVEFRNVSLEPRRRTQVEIVDAQGK